MQLFAPNRPPLVQLHSSSLDSVRYSSPAFSETICKSARLEIRVVVAAVPDGRVHDESDTPVSVPVSRQLRRFQRAVTPLSSFHAWSDVADPR